MTTIELPLELKKTLDAMKLLQQQWQTLIERFNENFLQPVIFFPPD